MKLLFDENVSPRLVAGLSDVSVSKDSDFHQVSFVRGPPPKVIWIRRGNCTTADIEALLRSNQTGILAFAAEADAAFLALS